MMIRWVLFFGFFMSSFVFAANIVILQGDASSFGKKYFSGYSSVVRESVKAYQYTEDKAQFIFEEISKSKPDIIVTIGVLPIAKLSNLLPLTTFIVGDFTQNSLEKKPNVVNMNPDVPIEIALDHFLEAHPGIKSLGSIYDPRNSLIDFNRLTSHLNKRGIQVASIKVDRSEDVAGFLNAFGGKIQGLVLLKDPTLAADLVISGILNTSRKFLWPVLSLNPSHRESGVFLSEGIDPIELGEQAWAVTQMILKDKKIPLVARQIFTREIELSISVKAIEDQKKSLADLAPFIQKRVQEGYRIRITR